jgi:hypothetical protein
VRIFEIPTNTHNGYDGRVENENLPSTVEGLRDNPSDGARMIPMRSVVSERTKCWRILVLSGFYGTVSTAIITRWLYRWLGTVIIVPSARPESFGRYDLSEIVRQWCWHERAVWAALGSVLLVAALSGIGCFLAVDALVRRAAGRIRIFFVGLGTAWIGPLIVVLVFVGREKVASWRSFFGTEMDLVAVGPPTPSTFTILLGTLLTALATSRFVVTLSRKIRDDGKTRSNNGS